MVHAVLVTHNRRDLLREALKALSGQASPPAAVLVVDNASSDGTPEMVRGEFPDVELLELSENQGGAGGFHEGMKRAYAQGAEWLWLMDDDTIAGPTALSELLAAAARVPEGPPLLLASKALWRDGRMHPMNAPVPDRARVERLVRGAELGLMPLRSATFVSLLVHRRAIERYGLPLKHFFMWSDDIEYTGRILKENAGFLVPTSVVEHRTATAHTAVSAPPERFYYHVRNTVFMMRDPERSPRQKLILFWVLASSTAQYLAQPGARQERLWFIGRGLRDGLRSAGGPAPSRR